MANEVGPISQDLSATAIFLNRDQIELKLKLLGPKIITAEINAVACPECLSEIKKFKQDLSAHKSPLRHVSARSYS
jgi:hypothetical protein